VGTSFLHLALQALTGRLAGAQERWDVIRAADELQRELAAGRVFAGFADSTCSFAPTFKVEKAYELQVSACVCALAKTNF
jgi:hypothetical protein